MQFGKLAVGGGQLMCAPAKSRAITSERHAAPGSHAHATLPLVLSGGSAQFAKTLASADDKTKAQGSSPALFGRFSCDCMLVGYWRVSGRGFAG